MPHSSFASAGSHGAAFRVTLRTSDITCSSPAAAAFTTSWHMMPTIAAVELESAPPLSGRK